MRKMACIVLVAGLAMSLSTVVFANSVGGTTIQLIGREISPGITLGDRTIGALFIGKFFDSTYSKELGCFSVTLDHNGQGIEQCGEHTTLLRFKLIMNFNNGGRLVLVGPESPAAAEWFWDNPAPACQNGNCPLTDYTDYILFLSSLDPTNPGTAYPCAEIGDPENSYIAGIPPFQVAKQRFGSNINVSGGSITGWLVHTPIISPAIFGTLTLD